MDIVALPMDTDEPEASTSKGVKRKAPGAGKPTTEDEAQVQFKHWIGDEDFKENMLSMVARQVNTPDKIYNLAWATGLKDFDAWEFGTLVAGARLTPPRTTGAWWTMFPFEQ